MNFREIYKIYCVLRGLTGYPNEKRTVKDIIAESF